MDIYLKNIEESNTQLTSKGLVTLRMSALRARPDALVISGMGGSGLAGEIIARSAKELGLTIPVFTWKNYDLPDVSLFKFKNPLYCFVSFSGGTEETISGIDALRKANAKANAAVVTTGGALKARAEKWKLPTVSFDPQTLTPRQATGKMFYSLIEVLFAAKAIRRRPPEFTRLEPESFRAQGKKLAEAFRGRVVCVYTDITHSDLGYIWKIRINETAKTLAFFDIVPEMDHNEIVGFGDAPAKTVALILKGRLSPRMTKRFAVTASLLRGAGVRTAEVSLKGASHLEEAWRTLMLSDWTAYFLAKASGVNPAETKIINTLKSRMKS